MNSYLHIHWPATSVRQTMGLFSSIDCILKDLNLRFLSFLYASTILNLLKKIKKKPKFKNHDIDTPFIDRSRYDDSLIIGSDDEFDYVTEEDEISESKIQKVTTGLWREELMQRMKIKPKVSLLTSLLKHRIANKIPPCLKSL